MFVMWDNVDGETTAPLAQGKDGGQDGLDAEDALWQDIWVALHVPDPDDPDNNLYTEVKVCVSVRIVYIICAQVMYMSVCLCGWINVWMGGCCTLVFAVLLVLSLVVLWCRG